MIWLARWQTRPPPPTKAILVRSEGDKVCRAIAARVSPRGTCIGTYVVPKREIETS